MGHMRAECSKIGTRQPKYLSWRGGNFNLLFAGTPCTAEEVEASRAAPLLFASIEINGNIERLLSPPTLFSSRFLSKLCIIRQSEEGGWMEGSEENKAENLRSKRITQKKSETTTTSTRIRGII